MFSALVINQFVIICFMALLVWAACTDFLTFTIPNRVTLGVLLLYPVFVLTADTKINWAFSLIIGLVIFGVGCGLFARKMMGGGDVKLLAVVTMWVGAEFLLPFFVVTIFSGLSLAILMAARSAYADARETASHPIFATVMALRHAPIMKLTIPYGVAVAAGGLYTGVQLLAG